MVKNYISEKKNFGFIGTNVLKKIQSFTLFNFNNCWEISKKQVEQKSWCKWNDLCCVVKMNTELCRMLCISWCPSPNEYPSYRWHCKKRICKIFVQWQMLRQLKMLFFQFFGVIFVLNIVLLKTFYIMPFSSKTFFARVNFLWCKFWLFEWYS